MNWRIRRSARTSAARLWKPSTGRAGNFPRASSCDLSGIAYSGLKDYTNAASHFNAAEVIAPGRDTNQLTGEFYFQFGATCERKGDYSDAERCFEKCLRLSPDYAEAQNYLGFMWADRGEKLDRARELIEKALRAEPKNSAYLDSMGWVLFKLGQPKPALEFVQKAIDLSEEEDPTLFDHLGDIYAALGQPDKAHTAWVKSLALEPNDEVRKKADSTATETIQPGTAPSRERMAYQFKKHYTREEAQALLPEVPEMA